MFVPMLALTIAAVGAVVSATSHAADSGDLAAYAQGAGVASVVGALVWAFRLMVKGELVSRSVSEVERQLRTLCESTQRLVEAGHAREATLRSLLEHGPRDQR